ncbi:unnamed protein product [Adineta ricciae]|uniref:NAD(P)(+)--arginine ADP-ribosyltransferase n=1 Tax=Adineta ricciae TaxID=249248 RepID=A0A816F5N4_ADIRI|nr:unnamed protein product [Adineta ricciae]CAF1656410.1 unnamed protein product [Adineta ricciae]
MATDQEGDIVEYSMRVMDVEGESSAMNTSVVEYQNAPNVKYEDIPITSIEEAVEALAPLIPDIQRRTEEIKSRYLNPPSDGLTLDQSVSIRLYSTQWMPRNKSLYIVLNATLRSKDKEKLKPWFRYIKLFLTALEQLPKYSRTVYRGVKADLHADYPKGKDIEWWAFSSCTDRIGVLEHESFLGKTGERTLFNIECVSAKNIEKHSAFEKENEVLLPPGIQFEVIDCLHLNNGLYIIQLREKQTAQPRLDSFLMSNSTTISEGKMSVIVLIKTGHEQSQW